MAARQIQRRILSLVATKKPQTCISIELRGFEMPRVKFKGIELPDTILPLPPPPGSGRFREESKSSLLWPSVLAAHLERLSLSLSEYLRASEEYKDLITLNVPVMYVEKIPINRCEVLARTRQEDLEMPSVPRPEIPETVVALSQFLCSEILQKADYHGALFLLQGHLLARMKYVQEDANTDSAAAVVSSIKKETIYKYTVQSNLKISPRHDLMMIFTCKVCETRTMKTVCRESYEKGVVVARCDGCNNIHLIADRLGWFGEPGSVEDFLAARGEEVKKGCADTLGFTLEDLAGKKTMETIVEK
ncbi:hypothetical protein RND71_016235 [Anisodus tanguticus]|uniref:DNL-type domain-containing protein n=1 Tax=Anisodus tanguticus TaxID=243964 RepID=A0AAE1S8I3_9SOLA|nr:hypothetical protein RND71_016235 [Anisodus tanguticus]